MINEDEGCSSLVGALIFEGNRFCTGSRVSSYFFNACAALALAKKRIREQFGWAFADDLAQYVEKGPT